MFTPQVIVLTVLVFFVLVGIHEWGHFFFAKRAGILVREFAIGFGPKIFSFTKGETKYTFRILPLGGFVRMAGEDPEIIQINPGQTVAVKLNNNAVTHLYLDQLDQRSNVLRGVVEHIDIEKELLIRLNLEGEVLQYPVDPRAMMVTRGRETQIAPWNRQFGSKTVNQRALAIFAGPMMNFLLAFVLFISFVYASGIPLKNATYLKIGRVVQDSAAEKANIHPGDVVYKVNDELIGGDSDKLIQAISHSPEKKMNWDVIRDGKHIQLEVTPQDVEGRGLVGVEINLPTRSPGFKEAVQIGGTQMGMATKQIFIGLKALVTLQFAWDDLGGPLRMVEVTGEAASRGYETLIFWAAILSLYLGIFNLLPFPALDGSRLVFLGIEAIRGKPVDPNRESIVHFIGFAMLMLLMLAVTYNDILRLFN